jgi:RNA polymerase sigma-70 factor (ECF subfamily)
MARGGLEPPPDPGEVIPSAIFMRAALARLRPMDRELLMLVAWDGLDTPQAAHVLGISPAMFSVRIHRARKRLMKELDSGGHSLSERPNRNEIIEETGP